MESIWRITYSKYLYSSPNQHLLFFCIYLCHTVGKTRLNYSNFSLSRGLNLKFVFNLPRHFQVSMFSFYMAPVVQIQTQSTNLFIFTTLKFAAQLSLWSTPTPTKAPPGLCGIRKPSLLLQLFPYYT